jgi:deoxyribodipyrimidine photolyase-related protein
MPTLWLFEDQLSIDLVKKHAPARVLLIESRKHFRTWPFHKKRIAFQLAAMRHFAAELTSAGVEVHHYRLDRKPYVDSISAIKHLVKQTKDKQLLVIDPSEHHTSVWIDTLPEQLGITIDRKPNTLFLTDRAEFARWARSLKSPVMEHFYRKMRTKLGVLMEPDDTPTGGAWNLDKENRKPAKPGTRFRKPIDFRMPSRNPPSTTRIAIFPLIPAPPTTLHFRPRGLARNNCSTTSSHTVFPSSATTKTPC